MNEKNEDRMDNSQQAFFALLKAGLWEREVRLLPYGKVDFQALYHLASEQKIVGLIAAGLGRVSDTKVSDTDMFPFGGDVLKMEQQNRYMNVFISHLFVLLSEEHVSALLVKGQGIAQCYERPLWRKNGDVDLLLDERNYELAKGVLLPISKKIGKEDTALKHQDMTIKGITVELHGTLHGRLSDRMDKVIDDIQSECLQNHKTRTWRCGDTDVPLPSADNDVLFVFTHILHHFFIEGVGLRQICDWCRLLWTYRDTLDVALLEKQLRKMGLMSEWKAFAALAVEWLGMSSVAMPLYDERFKAKGNRIMKLVLASGNFGKSLRTQRSRHYWLRKLQAAWHKTKGFVRIVLIFPKDSLAFFVHYLMDATRLVIRSI